MSPNLYLPPLDDLACDAFVTRMIKLAIAFAILLLPFNARAAIDWSKALVVTVVMVDDQFQPAHVVFHAGQPTELRLENRGKEMHEFTAPDFLRASVVRDKRALSSNGTDIVVQPGKTARIWLVPGHAGDYGLTCADHDWDGMVGSISVTP